MKPVPGMDIKQAWKTYWLARSEQARNALATLYLPLVRMHAKGMLPRFYGRVDYGDLISAGFFGLLDAIEAFDPDRGVKFETFSALRIRGAMLDEIRGTDWMPRLMRSKGKLFDNTVVVLSQELGRLPTESEVAEELGVSESEVTLYAKAAHQSALASMDGPRLLKDDDENLVSLYDVLPAKDVDADGAARRNEWAALAMDQLSDRQRKIVHLYYWRGKTNKAIGRRIGISESRVSQELTSILERLRCRLAGTETEFQR